MAAKMSVQLSVASEGGNGTDVPDLSIEVDDLDEALQRVKKARIKLEYGPAIEPWGVRRFYIRDPFGKVINILQHILALLLCSEFFVKNDRVVETAIGILGVARDYAGTQHSQGRDRALLPRHRGVYRG